MCAILTAENVPALLYYDFPTCVNRQGSFPRQIAGYAWQMLLQYPQFHYPPTSCPSRATQRCCSRCAWTENIGQNGQIMSLKIISLTTAMKKISDSVQEDGKFTVRCWMFESICSFKCFHCGRLLESDCFSPRALVPFFFAFRNIRQNPNQTFPGLHLQIILAKLINMQKQTGICLFILFSPFWASL